MRSVRPAAWAGVRPSIRLRLLAALALLAAATLLVGVLSWYALDRANARLDRLHRLTLSTVAQALDLSKRATDLATSAPFLLALNSPYLIRSEGNAILAEIGQIRGQWPEVPGNSRAQSARFRRQSAEALARIATSIRSLMDAADRLDRQRDRTLHLRVVLSAMNKRYLNMATAARLDPAERREWVLLQRMADALLSAVHVGNLPGLGEYRRRFSALSRAPLAPGRADELRRLNALADGPDGIFAIRRKELDQNLLARTALFRIRHNAGLISDGALVQARNAERFLSRKREETASYIRLTKLIILGVGLGAVVLALFSALFVSGYVTGNIHAIADAMLRLAEGDRSTHLPRPKGAVDEIGKLLHSFRVFRANALRLDRSNRQLHRKNALFEKVFSNITDGVAIIGEDGRLGGVNPSFAQVLHLPEDTARKATGIREALAASPFAEAAAARGLGERFLRACELQSEDGCVLELRCSRLPDGGEVWLFSDATERRRIEERLGQIRRIESLGKVTGEVAHDFANILSTISTNLHLLESTDEAGAEEACRERISDAVEIGNSLTQRLLAFARKQRLEPERTELNALILGLEDLVGISLGEGVRLKIAPADRALYVRVDPGQLESAVLNLCLNGAQAIEGEGEIAISLRETDAGMAQICICDSGCGMDAKVLSRALEPFYSARRGGRGTGLGLSSVYGFITQSGGEMHIESAPGLGTSVFLNLPLAAEERMAPAPALDGASRILLVEDAPDARTHAARLLREMGHEVEALPGFAQARERMLRGAPFDCLLTDIHLENGHSGWALVDLCMQHHPGARIIATSGKELDREHVACRYGPRVMCMPKPLSRAVLESAFGRRFAAQ